MLIIILKNISSSKLYIISTPPTGKERSGIFIYYFYRYAPLRSSFALFIILKSLRSAPFTRSGIGAKRGSVCKVITQDPDNLDEELESLASARNIAHTHSNRAPDHNI